MKDKRDEEEDLRSVTLQNAQSIFRARQRAEEELVRTKEALWRQSEWLRITLASIGDAVVTTDTAGRVLSLNAVAQELTGWKQQEVAGQPLIEIFRIVNEQTRQPVENPAARALHEGRVVGLANHTVLIARDGAEIPIDDSAAPIRDEQGRVLGSVLIFRSIAKRRQAEEALRQSERDLSDFFENATVGLHWVGPDGTILRVNRAELELLGYSREEYVGRHIAEFHVDQDVIDDILRRLKAAQTIQDYEARMRCKDGSIKYVLIDSSVRWANGEFLHSRCFTRDISDRKRAERLLQLQKDTLELLVQGRPLAEVLESVVRAMESHSPRHPVAAIHLLDETGDRFGLAIAPNLPRSYAEATQGMEIQTRTGPCCYAVLDRESVVVSEIESDSRWTAFADFALPLGIRAGWSTPILSSAEKVVGTFAVYYDKPRIPVREEIALMEVLSRTVALTIEHDQANRAKARLAAIVESSHDAIISKDLNGVITSWNTGAERIFGYIAEEAIGKPVTMLMPPDRVVEEARILETIRGGELIEIYETVRITKDGRRIDVSLSISPVRDSAGRIIGASKISRDITSRKRAERRLSTQHKITQALAESADLREAAPRILPAICDHLGWQVGALWYVDKQANVLRCVDLYSSVEVKHFEAASRGRTFESGIGLPGRVWADGKATWIRDVVQDSNFPRAPIAESEGLHSAFAFPISLHGKVLGVIEFFSHEIRQPESDLLEMMTAVGSQIGQFIERRRAEEALRESEARFRQLADAMPQIVWAARPDGYIDYYNERWYEYTGFPRSEYGQASWEPILHPDDVQRSVETYFGCIKAEKPYQIEYRFKDRHTGGYRWFLGRAMPIRDEAGRVVRWFGTCTDIDDTKQAERTTHFLADASAALAELTDYKSTLQKVAALAVPHFADWCAVDMQDADGSLQRLAVTHSDPAKVQLAHQLFRRYPPRPNDLHGVMKVLRTGEPDWAREISDSLLAELAQDEEHLRIVRELGLKSYICAPLRSRSRTLGVLTFGTAESGRNYDTTDLAAAEDLAHRAVIAIENANLLATLKETDKRKDEFLAMLAHELRNPLAPIRNAVQIFRAKGTPVPELQWATEVIDRQVQQMTRLVDDLLDVSRITRGKIELRKERIDLAGVVNNAVEASRPLIDKWEHELTVTLPPQPIMLYADATRMVQVLLNLLNNAAKYTDSGGRIWLSAALGDRYVEISVKDSGIGIPGEMLPRIFDIFAQVDRSLDRAEGGLGIGLTLVKRLIEMHGGTVEARSEGGGKGSEFVVRLPVADTSPVQGVSTSVGDGETQRPVTARRVLVVDDNQDAADSLGMLLRMMGNEVHTAHDGIEAVGAATTFQPDVILLDIGLPKLNGYEAARRIKEQSRGRDIVLIALTGWGQEDDRRRSLEAGFQHHMTKPVDFTELQKLLAASDPNRVE